MGRVLTAFDDWVARAHTVPIERVVVERGIKLRGTVERTGPCPVCGGTDRFSINIRKRLWNCRGCRKGGDAIALVMHLDGVEFGEAVSILAGETPNTGGTPAEIYLRMRGYTMPVPSTVRFLPPLKRGHSPALIVPYGLPREPEPGLLQIDVHAVSAVHLVKLKADGTGKADVDKPKITIASPAGMPAVLAALNDLLGLAITEGVEDALSVHQATGLGAWATGGAGFMPKIAAAVPDYTDAITVYAHADEAGQLGARELAAALSSRRFEVRLEGMQWP
jgi:phage/plasmid primase-like uncharacterized protein